MATSTAWESCRRRALVTSESCPHSHTSKAASSKANRFATNLSLSWTFSRITTSLSKSEGLLKNIGRSFIPLAVALSDLVLQPLIQRTCIRALRTRSRCSSHTRTRIARRPLPLKDLAHSVAVSNGAQPRKMLLAPSVAIQARRITSRTLTSRP